MSEPKFVLVKFDKDFKPFTKDTYVLFKRLKSGCYNPYDTKKYSNDIFNSEYEYFLADEGREFRPYTFVCSSDIKPDIKKTAKLHKALYEKIKEN